MDVVLVMFKDGKRRDFPLSKSKMIIGRKPDCELRIPTGDVSRQHCEIEVEGDELTVRDLGSSNGTYVNGKRIAETTLEAGDELRVGPVQFVVQIDGDPQNIDADDFEPLPAAVAVDAKPPAPRPQKPPAAPVADEDDEDELSIDDLLADADTEDSSGGSANPLDDEIEEILDLDEDDFDVDELILEDDEEDKP